jgi:O-antigen biosynthesis protein WbqP
MYIRVIKPAIDLSIAVFVLVFLSPIMLLVAGAILIEDGRPILFEHERTGRGGKGFQIFKFRSMGKGAAIVESAQATTLRITRVGAVIRRLNIDELPQLFNVMRQEMSLVGPRPGLPTQRDLHDLRRANGAIDLLPGITGLAQIRSYDGMTTKAKAALDGDYAKSVSLLADIKIILSTFLYFLKRPPTY